MKRRWIVVAVVGLLPVVYVLSEAPLVRLTGQVPRGGAWELYNPVHYIMFVRLRPLSGHMWRWAKLWEVEGLFARADNIEHERQLRGP